MITVCIATYNGEKYIKEELLSILPQLSAFDEIVISDDGSTDKTISCIQSLNDSRIRIVSNPSHNPLNKPGWNVSKNFENALLNARGDVLFLADQDDIWMPDKVSKCMKALESSDLVIHNLALFQGEGLVDLHQNMWSRNFHFRNYLLLKGKYYGCAMAFKRKVLEWSLPFPRGLMLHDYWIGIMSELCGSVVYLPEPLIKYRLHDNNVSAVSANSLVYKIWYRFYIIYHYSKRMISYKLRVLK